MWIITNETHNGSEIHRFFDTSPISPSSRFIATVQFSSFDTAGILDDFSALYKPAVVQVIDLHTGKRVIRDYTDAWDSQLGAQVQWGATDDFLFFNTLHDSVSGELQSDGCYSIVGVRLNIKTMAKTNLMCPVYHVSNDGKTAAAPNLLNIHFTQKGYGVRLLDSRGTRRGHRRGAAHDDGLFLTNTETGECRLLISLHRLALTVGQDTVRTPMYGFHTKFSSDGSLIMFVVRTMEQPIPPRKGLVRVQHMFVVDITGTQVRRMISWASYPFVPARCPEIAAAARVGSGNGVKDGEVNASLCSPVHLRDGNHPNWVPNSHRISMNLQKEISQTKPMSHATNMIHTVSKFFNPQLVMTRPKWNIVSLDVDAHADDFIFHYRYPIVEEAVGQKMQYIPTTIEQTAATVEPAESAAESASNIPNATPISAPNAAPNANAAPRVTAYHELHVRIDHSVGSGHPTYHPSGNYIITDAYPKEMQFLKASGEEKERTSTTSSTSSSSRSSIKGATGKVPLRLIEISTQREIQLLQVRMLL